MKTLFLFLFYCIALIGVRADESGTPAYYTVLQQSTNTWDGTAIPPYPEGQPQITVVKVTIAPGTTLPMHTHPSINAAYMIRGEATVITKDGKTKVVKAGEAMIEVVDTWHYGHNHGTEPAELVVFYAGTPGLPLANKHEHASDDH
jgi:quercetin dioxygenase-like cupin family protein